MSSIPSVRSAIQQNDPSSNSSTLHNKLLKMHTKLCEKKEKFTNLPKKFIMGVQVDHHT
jgi:hypothetical protein